MDIRRTLLDQFSSQSLFIDSYPAQEKELTRSLERWLTGTSSSVLILGPRGAGKTTLVNRCFDRIPKKKHIRVNLNGFLQTNDIAAVKEMAVQLDQDFQIDTDNQEIAFHVGNSVRDMLRTTNVPVAVVLEEFDRLASQRSSTEKQCLLYSLLDYTQNPMWRTSLLVIGISSHLDAFDTLEKRVRSRACHKPLLLLNDWPLETYLEYAKRMLRIENGKKKAREEIVEWNGMVERVLMDPPVMRYLEHQFRVNRSLNKLKEYLTVVVSLLDEENFVLSPDAFRIAMELFRVDSRHIMLEGLSVLELSIVLAARHFSHFHSHCDDLNFELIYHEYCKISRERYRDISTAPKYPEAVMLQAFDKLCRTGVFSFIKTPKSHVHPLRRFEPVKLQISANMIKDYVKKVKKDDYPSYLNEWLQFD